MGIFANCEVEVTRRPGNPVGQRTDILVNTVRRGRGGQVLDPIAAVIEVKGCWNSEVFTGLDEQLVRDYMVDLSAPVGIFLVGWFNKTDWDPSDNRRRQTPQRPISYVQEQLDQQAAAAPEGFQVRSMVLDIKAPARDRVLGPFGFTRGTTIPYSTSFSGGRAFTGAGWGIRE